MGRVPYTADKVFQSVKILFDIYIFRVYNHICIYFDFAGEKIMNENQSIYVDGQSKFTVKTVLFWILNSVFIGLLSFFVIAVLIDGDFIFNMLSELLGYNFFRNNGDMVDVLYTVQQILAVVFPAVVILLVWLGVSKTKKYKRQKEEFIKKALEAAAEKRKKEEEARLEAQKAEELKRLAEEDEDDDYEESKKAFLEQKDFENTQKQFAEYAESQGLKISPDAVRKIFSAISASRAIFIKSRLDTVKLIAEILTGFFSNNAECINHRMLSELPGEENIEYNSFFTEIDKSRDGFIHFVLFCNVDKQAFSDVYSDVLQSAYLPHSTHFASNYQINEYTKKSDFIFPHNIWYIAPLDFTSDSYTEDITQTGIVIAIGDNEVSLLERSGFEIPAQPPVLEPAETVLSEIAEDADMTAADEAPKKKGMFAGFGGKPTGAVRFEEIINEAVKENTLSLDSWKKIDALEEYLASICTFKLGNVVSRQIERFAAAYMCGGGDEKTALDAAIACKIMPMITMLPREKLTSAEEKLPEFMDRVFGLTSIPQSERLIRRLFYIA